MKRIIFYDKKSRKIMCLTEMSGEFWVCFKHPDGQFVTERKATFDDIQKIVSAPKIGEREHSAAQTCANCGTDGCSAKGTDKTPNGCDEWRALPSGEHNTGSPKLLALADYALNALQRADYAACGDFINNLRKQLRAGA